MREGGLLKENKREIGAVYEKQAVAFLQEKGYEIVETNFRCRQGEIDIIAREGEYLVFIEVKYRKDTRAGNGLEAVDYRKQQKIIQTARYYLYSRQFGEEVPCRFDVIGICPDKITLIRNAFET